MSDEVRILGRDHRGLVASQDGERYYLSECCFAAISVGGSFDDEQVYCKECFEEVPFELLAEPRTLLRTYFGEPHVGIPWSRFADFLLLHGDQFK